MSELGRIQDELGYRFKDLDLLVRALTHSSYGHENDTRDNERLEFLGDAVLQLCTTLLLEKAFPNASEGQLSRLRSNLVNTRALAEIGRQMEVGKALLLGRGECETGGRSRKRNLANTTEALLGAVYRDAGLAACQDVVAGWMTERIANLENGKGKDRHGWKDPKSRLQEITQQDGGSTPRYDTVHREGPPHAPTFHVVVTVDGTEVGRGEGRSKAAAARAAAEAALEHLDTGPRVDAPS